MNLPIRAGMILKRQPIILHGFRKVLYRPFFNRAAPVHRPDLPGRKRYLPGFGQQKAPGDSRKRGNPRGLILFSGISDPKG